MGWNLIQSIGIVQKPFWLTAEELAFLQQGRALGIEPTTFGRQLQLLKAS